MATSTQAKRYFSQWTAQFYAAAELTRRNYIVSFTMGNAPKTDLLVQAASGKSFRIQCKGQRNESTWITGYVPNTQDLYYIFVYIPRIASKPPRFFIMDSQRVKILVKEKKDQSSSKKPWNQLSWKTPHPFENEWNILPE